MRLSLLACQITVPPMITQQEKSDHVNRVSNLVNAALIDTTVDAIVLPELANLDYSRATFEQLEQLAEPLDGPTCAAYASMARRHNAHVIGGFARKSGNDFFISQVVFGCDGQLVGTYDKIHVAQYGASMEKEYFARGRQLLVFEIKGIRVAPIICYDIRIPELFRTLCVDRGVQCVLHCGAYARDESFFSWKHFAVTRAMENQIFLLSLNRAGDFFGESILCPPWVDENNRESVFPSTEVLRHVELDMTLLDQIREKYPFLHDRLDDYKSLPVASHIKT
ncbi:carbon-nitrogen hydrolase family protein [Roseovarius sp. 2305UL8-3]|uniref:carbon-nitrogen hydrolase family protein n=1 Tax=Roseovarius conchicola TaxID=3121636 RepID=UPI0035276916